MNSPAEKEQPPKPDEISDAVFLADVSKEKNEGSSELPRAVDLMLMNDTELDIYFTKNDNNINVRDPYNLTHEFMQRLR